MTPAHAILMGPFHVGGSTTGLRALSCGTPTSCTTFDFNGQTFESVGTNWHRGPRISGPSFEVPTSLSCPSSQFCAIGLDGGHVGLLVHGHVTYRALNADAVDAVSCASRYFCIFVGDNDMAYTYSRSKWSSGTTIPSLQSMPTVSCVSSSYCVAADDSGDATVVNGHLWRAIPLKISAIDGESQLSCASRSFCVAVLLSGRWARFDGVTWRIHKSFEGDHSQGYTPTMLACRTPGHYSAASTDGRLYKLEVGRWTELGYLFRQSQLSRQIQKWFPTPAVSVACAFARSTGDAGGKGRRRLGASSAAPPGCSAGLLWPIAAALESTQKQRARRVVGEE